MSLRTKTTEVYTSNEPCFYRCVFQIHKLHYRIQCMPCMGRLRVNIYQHSLCVQCMKCVWGVSCMHCSLSQGQQLLQCVNCIFEVVYVLAALLHMIECLLFCMSGFRFIEQVYSVLNRSILG